MQHLVLWNLWPQNRVNGTKVQNGVSFPFSNQKELGLDLWLKFEETLYPNIFNMQRGHWPHILGSQGPLTKCCLSFGGECIIYSNAIVHDFSALNLVKLLLCRTDWVFPLPFFNRQSFFFFMIRHVNAIWLYTLFLKRNATFKSFIFFGEDCRSVVMW